MTKYLVDTGPLVAFLNGRDNHHQWAVARFAEIQPPLLTCEAVLTEAFFLLRIHPAATDGLIEMIRRKIVTVSFRLDDEFARVGKLLRRYADTKVSLADACLVRMSELHTDSYLFTLDSDFRFYRRNGRQVIPTITPGDYP